MINANSGAPAIRELQQKLNYYASSGLVVDGVFGARTLAAVQKWERDTNVPAQYRTTGYSVSDYTLDTLGIGSVPAPSGGGSSPSPGATGNVYFEWKAPAVIGVLGADWNTKSARAASLLAQRGFNSTVTWEWAAYVPPTYFLVIRGNAPVGVSGAERVIADLAEQAGFSVDRSAISFSVSASAFVGSSNGSNPGGSNPGGSNPNGNDFWKSLGIGSSAGLLVLLILIIAIGRS